MLYGMGHGLQLLIKEAEQGVRFAFTDPPRGTDLMFA